MITCPTVKGELILDESHFDYFVNTLFDYALCANVKIIEQNILDEKITLPWYVQHGDCKNRNILWLGRNNEFELIDLEAIDLYPPLYDVFYYLFITKKERSIEVLKSKRFNDLATKFFMKHNLNTNIDACLACYAYYTSSKLNKNSVYYEFDFYLFWRKFDSFDWLPLTKKVLDAFDKKMHELRIR